MFDLEERLAALTVSAQSPDGRIHAWARGPADLAVEFTGGSFRAYTERTMERQLGALATVLWVRYRRAYLEIEDGFLAGPDGWVERDADGEFMSGLAEITAGGWSPSGAVTVSTRGLVEWEFRIRDGEPDRLGEPAFGSEVTAAARDAVRTYRAGTVLFTAGMYGRAGPAGAGGRAPQRSRW